MSSRNVAPHFAAFFNLGHFYYLRGKRELAREWWARYVNRWDSSSDYARFAARILPGRDGRLATPRGPRYEDLPRGLLESDSVRELSGPGQRILSRAGVSVRGGEEHVERVCVHRALAGVDEIFHGVRVGMTMDAARARLSASAKGSGLVLIDAARGLWIYPGTDGRIRAICRRY